MQAGMPVDVCHVYEEGDEPKAAKRGATGKTPKKGAGQKRKRGCLVESEEEEVDYSQLDRHTEDEAEEAEAGLPVPKRRRTQRATVALPPAPEPEPESPVKQKVARMNSRVEVDLTRSPSSRNPSTSPGKRKRAAAEED